MRYCVSVIIPSYNSAAYIEQAISSALSQHNVCCEIIVVDDGSIDNTKDKLKPFHGAIRYFEQPNSGPSAARNKGINNSTADFIAFLDADDIWMPEKLECQLELLLSRDTIGLVTCGRMHVNQQGALGSTYIPPVNRYAQRRIIEQLAIENIVGGASSVLTRRSVLLDIGCFDDGLAVSEDTDLWIRIAQKYEIKCVEKPLLHYRHVANSQSSHALRNIENQLILAGRLLRQGVITRSVKNKALCYKYYCAAISSIQSQCISEARRYVLHSCSCAPFYFMSRVDMIALLVRIMVGETVFSLYRRLKYSGSSKL